MADAKKRRRSMCEVQVLKCHTCGAAAVSIDNHRITDHKCVGAWNIVRSERIEVAEIHRALGKKAAP